MYGVVTRNRDELSWPEFDHGFFEAKDVTGRWSDPTPDGINMVSCFGDNAAAESDPSLVPVTQDGEPATRDQPYFDWSYICPTREQYVDQLFELIDECGTANESVRLDDVGFPRPEYCYCSECQASFEASEYANREAWRASVISDFVERATERIPGQTYLTLYPDPYPGHLYSRAGIELTAISPLVDEFVVPIYDMAYSTTYWLEALASGFTDRLTTPFSIELYAVNIEVGALVHAAEVASQYATGVYFAYDAGTAREVIRRLRAEGTSAGPNDEPSE